MNGGPDVSTVLERRDRVIHGLDDEGQVEWVDSRGIELVRGHGRLDGERRVRVNGEVLEAREAVVIAVGSGSAPAPIVGLADVESWTNREVTTMSEIPSRLIVLGGGVVGVEMAQAWRSLGSAVVIVKLFDRLLAREEPFVARSSRRPSPISASRFVPARRRSAPSGPVRGSCSGSRAASGSLATGCSWPPAGTR